MQPLASSCPAISRSTSSSDMRSPSVARTCRSSAPMMVPLPSLSKTRRPSTKSSKLPLSLEREMCWSMGRKVSKSTILELISSGRGLPRTLSTSALVGFWPRARITSPHWAKVIFISPLGVRSNSRKASRNSSICSGENSRLMLLGSKSGSLGGSGRGSGTAAAGAAAGLAAGLPAGVALLGLRLLGLRLFGFDLLGRHGDGVWSLRSSGKAPGFFFCTCGWPRSPVCACVCVCVCASDAPSVRRSRPRARACVCVCV
ncbi:hypothetical protein ANANG_G00269940 [Anguilla anguilla]|uniref:Uncharacterized protein n=1 Tax=Anguilla anguilla TaxID=7936 RepID=A0A9D3LT93_ANGAN|nr:hypothetical protein ANANG_G00269940 [Anguilla anguilla]